MPFDIGESINYVADTILSAPIVLTIANNPIYTSLVLTFVIILIILITFRDVNIETGESLTTLSIRAGFWVAVLLVGALFLQNKVCAAELLEVGKSAEYDGLFNSGYIGNKLGSGQPNELLEDSVVPVVVPK
jgi:hypothetical protein